MPEGLRVRPLVLAGFFGGALWNAASTPAHAGAFTLPSGTGQIIVGGTATTSDTYLDAQGKSFHGATYRKLELPALIEYGVTDWFTALFAPSLLATRVGDDAESRYAGPGYTDLGARIRLVHEGPSVISVQVVGRLAGASNGYSPAQVGQTDNEVDARVLLGRGFEIAGWPAFADVQFAYRLRSGNWPNEMRLDATLGVRPDPNWLVLLQSFNVASDGSGGGGIPATRYNKAQVSLVWDVTTHWSVQLGAVITYAGMNALRERGLVAALWYRF